MFNFGNPLAMLGKLQELPEKLQQLNQQMKSETVTASSADGLVTVVMSGTGQVQSVRIQDGLARESMEQGVLDATNTAGAAAKQLYADAISRMAADMNLKVPGLDGILTSITGAS